MQFNPWSKHTNGLQKKFAAGQQKEYREARVNQLLDRELLPHLGDQPTTERRRQFSLAVLFVKFWKWL